MLSDRLLRVSARVAPHERRAVLLAFVCYFFLLGSYYILRPVRDTVATVFGTASLQNLFTATFVGTMIFSPLFGALASRLKLSRLLPGVFWFWLLNVVLFAILFRLAPQNRWLGASYYVWFSVVNLFMVSVFWSLMVDLFSPSQALRLFGLIAAGGELGAIAGPLLTRGLVSRLGLPGLLLVAAAGFLLLIALVHALMREKQRLRLPGEAGQRSSLEHQLAGKPWDGVRELFRSRYALAQAAFMLLMTWINTVAYFFQTDLVAHAFSGIAARTQAIADIDLAVNVLSALILLFGLSRFVQRFGVTAALVLNPLLMVAAFLGIIIAPSLLMIQAVQVVRRVAQYAIARPSREMSFTVVPQASRYKTKNVIDTVVYRFGDLSSAWVQAGLRAVGVGLSGTAAVGVAASLVWGAVAAGLGASYAKIRKAQTEHGELLYSRSP
jgi:ATP:ADP antiporter, AAA family